MKALTWSIATKTPRSASRAPSLKRFEPRGGARQNKSAPAPPAPGPPRPTRTSVFKSESGAATARTAAATPKVTQATAGGPQRAAPRRPPFDPRRRKHKVRRTRKPPHVSAAAIRIQKVEVTAGETETRALSLSTASFE